MSNCYSTSQVSNFTYTHIYTIENYNQFERLPSTIHEFMNPELQNCRGAMGELGLGFGNLGDEIGGL